MKFPCIRSCVLISGVLASALAVIGCEDGGSARSDHSYPYARTRTSITQTELPPPAPQQPGAEDGAVRGAPKHGQLDHPIGDSIESPGAAERYTEIRDNPFVAASSEPLSTFSIDVDHASYANVRRFVNNGFLPPENAVRIEELINYFDYEYPQPTGDDPLSITTDVAVCPWNPSHRLVLIGLQGRQEQPAALPASNLVFLIDVSGSMNSADKLPLVKRSLLKLVDAMRDYDRIAIVTYASSAGVALASTEGVRRDDIRDAINGLSAGGSTAGADGIQAAYDIAEASMFDDGNNRVILCTDGDFNVGPSTDSDLVTLIERERDRGIFLSVVGVGTDDLNDAMMEKVADHGNGNYAYIDSDREADKVFVREMSGTLDAIAKDVKLQVEFNPKEVWQYRLIGYEDRMLAAEDFDDDRKDAGELGGGNSVTALYEIIPADARTGRSSEPSLGERIVDRIFRPASFSNDQILEMKLRYKRPNATTSRLVRGPAIATDRDITGASRNLQFAAAVAEWGMLLRHSPYAGNASYSQVIAMASRSLGADTGGYRREFLDVAQATAALR